MLLKLLAAAAFLFLILMAIRWFARQPPQNIARLLRRLPLYLGAGLLILLAARGRLSWLFGALGAVLALLPRLIPLVQYIPVVGRIYRRYKSGGAGGQGTQPGQASGAEIRFVRMKLDHMNGEIDGDILAGRYKGKRLSQLTLQQVLELLQECGTHDIDSVRLIQAFLDRAHGAGWRAQARAESARGGNEPPARSMPMSRGEAYEILGLDSGASDEAIVAAHRRLMQKFHPDRGGSDYLAARINQAKDVLLGK